ncbi:hypothetical protein FRC00_002061 [Tulasnella sp. 408]|nr:hypothetical protein FRC00_002061 [Tulasnella sp. 408]
MHPFNDVKAAPGSMPEQDNRPLPEGWTRQWDPNYKRYFFIDTKANPPRSTWDYPLNDVQTFKTHGLPADSDSESARSSSSSSSSRSDKKRAKRAEKRAHRHERREEKHARKEEKHAKREEKHARKHEKRD